MKNLHLYLSLLFILTCAKEDSQDPETTPNNIVPKYTLIASAGDGGSVTGGGTFASGTQVSVTATPSAGYTFSGWSNGSSNNPITVTLNSNTSITANFALIPVYSISVSAEEGGSVSSNGGDYQEGTEITLTATPDEGYEFSGWSDGSTEATRVITASEDVTLTATFTELEYSYQLTVTSTEGGSISSEGGEYNEGTEVTITATPDEGYRFIGWSDGSTEESTTITLSEDTSIEAIFELIPVYTLTVTSTEGGTVSTNGGQYEQGSEISISAISNGCYNFTQWSDGETSPERVVNVNSNIEISAEFEFYPNNQTISNIIFKNSCSYDFTLNQSFNESSTYKIDNIGWLGIKLDESHDAYYYPTSADYNSPGYFDPLITDLNYYDFNSDELEDVLIGWTYSPHTVDRETKYNYTILINNGDGTFYADHDRILSSSIHDVLMPYRTMMEDFNGDGIKDIISASMGKIERLPDGNSSTRWERIPLLLSLPDGTYFDASTNIEGQEDGISPPEDYGFGHDLSVGDVDGDGDIDIYTGRVLLINNGTGNFLNKTSELTYELRLNNFSNMSSVIDDFNNDGVDDFFNLSMDNRANNSDFSQYEGIYSLSKNNMPSYSNSKIGFVNGGKYGTNQTKFNHAVSYDVDLDGYMDVVTSVTRSDPYYIGKSIQVFLNVEDTDGSRKFINADYLVSDTSSLDHMHGEGQLLVKDLNNDGILDIAHSSASHGSPLGDQYGLQFYLNLNGQLQLQSTSLIPYVLREQSNNVSDTWVADGTKLERSFPIDINGNGWIDIISSVHVNYWLDERELVFYSIINKD